MDLSRRVLRKCWQGQHLGTDQVDPSERSRWICPGTCLGHAGRDSTWGRIKMILSKGQMDLSRRMLRECWQGSLPIVAQAALGFRTASSDHGFTGLSPDGVPDAFKYYMIVCFCLRSAQDGVNMATRRMSMYERGTHSEVMPPAFG